MSFGFPGQNLYGTAGGSGTIPDAGDVALGEGRTFTAFLILTGPQTIRDREAVESVVRIIDESGGSLLAIVVLENGGVVDSNATQIDFGSGIVATQVSPGVVLITVNGITSAMITDGTIQGGDIAAGAIDTAQLADFAVTAAKLDDLAVTTGKINDGAVTAIKLADNILSDDFVAAGGGDGDPLFNVNTRNTASSGRSNVNSTTGEEKLTTALTLSSPASKQKDYRLFVRGSCTLEKTISGNIEMRVGIRLGAGNLVVSDWVGTQFGLEPITHQYAAAMVPSAIAGDSSTVTAFIECKVSTGSGFFHGGTVEISAIPLSMG